MKRLTLVAFLCYLTGCGLFDIGGTDRCDGRDGLFIQTDRDTYQIGEKATLTVENCTNGELSMDRNYNYPPDFKLEKKSVDEWEIADQRGSSLYDIESDDIQEGETYDFALPIEPSETLIDSIAGTYRYRLDIYDGYDASGAKNYLSEKMRRSNTFEITE
jgi:hypothetical protein